MSAHILPFRSRDPETRFRCHRNATEARRSQSDGREEFREFVHDLLYGHLEMNPPSILFDDNDPKESA